LRQEYRRGRSARRVARRLHALTRRWLRQMK
jgi:hypothetical protein